MRCAVIPSPVLCPPPERADAPPRILLLPCCRNILLLRSEAGRTMSGREPTFLLAGCSALDTGTGRGVFA
jgi:hypothetical protein